MSETAAQEHSASQDQAPRTRTFLALVVAAAAWIIPGLGHFLLRRWGRALALFVATAGLAFAGYRMRGAAFSPYSSGPFGTLGFFADSGSGVFYFLRGMWETAAPDISRAVGEYGTRFLAAAGILNWAGVVDAYEIARGWRR